ncbi:MAG: hypothetical protein IMZ52_10220 [Actinobacteria bacterium]|nr:hypothetical protein [Actinomycetota bacterium]MBE3122560.1 hypothetical protein [Thermoplasmata archaeon]
MKEEIKDMILFLIPIIMLTVLAISFYILARTFFLLPLSIQILLAIILSCAAIVVIKYVRAVCNKSLTHR